MSCPYKRQYQWQRELESTEAERSRLEVAVLLLRGSVRRMICRHNIKCPVLESLEEPECVTRWPQRWIDFGVGISRFRRTATRLVHVEHGTRSGYPVVTHDKMMRHHLGRHIDACVLSHPCQIGSAFRTYMTKVQPATG